MMNLIQCIKCGKKAKYVFDFLCSDCFVEENLKVPNSITLKKCNSCKKLIIENKEKDFNEETIANAIKKYFSMPNSKLLALFVNILNDKEIFVKARFLHVKTNQKYNVQKRLQLNFLQATCKKCRKLSGNYYEAIIQLRLKEKNKEAENMLKDFLNSLQKEEPLAKITKEDKKKTGKDFYLPSNKIAKKIAKRLKEHFKCTLKISYSLYGMKDGKELKRTTYALTTK